MYNVSGQFTAGATEGERMNNVIVMAVLFIANSTFRMYLLNDEGELRRGYYRTREEAEKALEGNKDY